MLIDLKQLTHFAQFFLPSTSSFQSTLIPSNQRGADQSSETGSQYSRKRTQHLSVLSHFLRCDSQECQFGRPIRWARRGYSLQPHCPPRNLDKRCVSSAIQTYCFPFFCILVVCSLCCLLLLSDSSRCFEVSILFKQQTTTTATTSLKEKEKINMRQASSKRNKKPWIFLCIMNY